MHGGDNDDVNDDIDNDDDDDDDKQPWPSGRTLRCGWEVPGSRPGRSRTLNCTHRVTRDPTPSSECSHVRGVYTSPMHP